MKMRYTETLTGVKDDINLHFLLHLRISLFEHLSLLIQHLNYTESQFVKL